ncbi:mitochondrial import receptor subunit TOM6 homolog [Impatiens glandulifera]|uniref:mitochondrial import receptor subunit TOM6 homolog n=1 Tax=Impatiens glandulifera TaxID=253017 RepID=UPI001FB0D195|nr:mitochondrial import receptor subunit TOM6 homolog [Impatiens glandulifera]
MFPSMFARKPDKAAALKKMKIHVATFGVWVAVVRLTPYVLHYFSDHNEELKLEL